MSLLPYLFEDYRRPSAGLLADLLQFPSYLNEYPAGYTRSWKPRNSEDAGSTVAIRNDKFEANLDVKQFKPEEITVKVTGENIVTVEGKHEEKEDEHGHIYRHFVRRYVVPKNCDLEKVESKLSSDGVLSISVPCGKKEIEPKEVPIVQTGVPAKAIKERTKSESSKECKEKKSESKKCENKKCEEKNCEGKKCEPKKSTPSKK